MREELSTALPDRIHHQLVEIQWMRVDWLRLELWARLDCEDWAALGLPRQTESRSARIFCFGAVDYAFRPWNSRTPVQFEVHRTHRVLENPDLQFVPGGDGDRFEPPKEFQLLTFGTCYIISEKFQLEWT